MDKAGTSEMLPQLLDGWRILQKSHTTPILRRKSKFT
jgi:hypothetical protein